MCAEVLKDTPPHQLDSVVPRSHNCRQKVGGRDRDRTGDPLLAKHGSRLQPLYPSLLTTNVSNQSGNLLLAQRYPQWHENVAFLHSPRHSGAPAFWNCVFGNPSSKGVALPHIM